MKDHFPGSKHVSDLQIDHYSDRQIFDFAGKNQFTIVSKDKDFYHILNTLGPPPKVVFLLETVVIKRLQTYCWAIVNPLLNLSGAAGRYLLLAASEFTEYSGFEIPNS